MLLPAPPPDGGFLVLNDAQINNLDLVCLIKSAYPRTKLYAQRALPREVHRVMSIGNAEPGQPTGMLGYYARQTDAVRLIRAAMRKTAFGSR